MALPIRNAPLIIYGYYSRSVLFVNYKFTGNIYFLGFIWYKGCMKTAFRKFIRAHDFKNAYDCAVVIHDYRYFEELRKAIREDVTVENLEIYRKTYDFWARERFDDFMLAVEWDRPAEEQFWLPRRDKLLPMAQCLQDLEDNKLDELFLSQPPRTGKSTLIVFFLVWVILRDSERSNLYCTYTASVAETFYDRVMEVFDDPYTYRWKDLFPDSKVASTNRKDLTMNLDRKKGYASFTARSLYANLNGGCDCNGYEIADDLHSGIEEALSKDRLNTAWARVTNNYLPRAKEGAKRLWIGTRWSQADAIARRLDILENDPKSAHIRYKVFNLPALNEDDESNFDYKYGVGFSTQMYQQVRSAFERGDDLASWLAQYQGVPIERSGVLFSPDDFRYFNGVLPDADPDRIYMAVDPAWGGGDYVASPIIYQFDTDMYIVDVVFNKGDKRVTQPEIVDKAIKWGVQAIYVEGTRVTADYGQGLNDLLKSRNYRLNLQTSSKHFTGGGKFERICDKAPDIKEFMVFLENGVRDKEYQRFMENVFSFKFSKSSKQHDDAPDSLAMAIAFAFRGEAKVEIKKRFW